MRNVSVAGSQLDTSTSPRLVNDIANNSPARPQNHAVTVPGFSANNVRSPVAMSSS